MSWSVWTHNEIPAIFERLYEAIAYVETLLPGFQAVPAPDRLFCYPDSASDWFERSVVIVHNDAAQTRHVEAVRRMRAEQQAERRAALAARRPIVDMMFDLAFD
ncbi:MAG: hypothetical protein AB7U73_05090 [Pirellulales bacterium]